MWNQLRQFSLSQINELYCVPSFRSIYKDRFRFSKFISSYIFFLKENYPDHSLNLLIDDDLNFSNSTESCFTSFSDNRYGFQNKKSYQILDYFNLKQQPCLFLLFTKNTKIINPDLEEIKNYFSFVEGDNERNVDPQQIYFNSHIPFELVIENIKKKSFELCNFSICKEYENTDIDKNNFSLFVFEISKKSKKYSCLSGEFLFKDHDFFYLVDEIVSKIKLQGKDQFDSLNKKLKILVYCQDKKVAGFLTHKNSHKYSIDFICDDFYAAPLLGILRKMEELDIFIDISHYPQVYFCKNTRQVL